jgi:hypothetical protein
MEAMSTRRDRSEHNNEVPCLILPVVFRHKPAPGKDRDGRGANTVDVGSTSNSFLDSEGFHCETKKADVAEHPEVFHHVGLLLNEPPGKSRVALQLVIRLTLSQPST